MRKQHHYGKREDGTYAFSVSFSGVRTVTISALLFDDTDMEATPDTWLTQTNALIERIRRCIGNLSHSVVSIKATNDPLYGLEIVVKDSDALAIERRVETYVLSMHSTFQII